MSIFNIKSKLESFTPEKKLLYKKRSVNILINVVRYFFLLALSYVVLFQLIYMISYSVRPPIDEYNP